MSRPNTQTGGSNPGGDASRTPPKRPSSRPQAIHEGILADIADTDLSEGSKRLLRNLITRDFVLANLQKEELHEFKWKLRVKQELFFAMHPSQNSFLTGEDRAAIYDDPTDTLRPLSQEQKLVVRDFFDGVWMRVTRSLDMKQQEMLNTQVREHRAEQHNGQTSNGLLGRVRGE